MAEAKKLEGTGTSTHCSVSQRETFEALWADLMATGLMAMDIAAAGDVQENMNEFHVLLKPVGETRLPGFPRQLCDHF